MHVYQIPSYHHSLPLTAVQRETFITHSSSCFVSDRSFEESFKLQLTVGYHNWIFGMLPAVLGFKIPLPLIYSARPTQEGVVDVARAQGRQQVDDVTKGIHSQITLISNNIVISLSFLTQSALILNTLPLRGFQTVAATETCHAGLQHRGACLSTQLNITL